MDKSPYRPCSVQGDLKRWPPPSRYLRESLVQTHWLKLLVIGLMVSSVFAWDLITPRGVTVWVVYSLIPLLTLFLPVWWSSLVVASLCTVLIMIGLSWSPPGIPLHVSLLNRTLGIAVLWIIALGVALAQRRLTASRRSEDTLRAGEERLRLTFQEARVGTWSWDVATNVATWHTGLKALYGLPSEPPFNPYADFSGSYEDFLATIHPDDRDPVAAAVSQSLAGVARYDVEFRVVWPDGSVHWLADKGTVLRDKTGKATGMRGLSIDITERKQLEAARQIFVSLADNSTEFIGMCDMNFRPFYANAAAMRMVGLESLEQVCRTPVKDFFFPEDQVIIYEEFFPRVIQEGKGELEIRFRHFTTGEALWMLYNVFTLTDPKGKPIGLATVSRDITARKRAEEALQASQERLALAQRSANAGVWDWEVPTNTLSWSPEYYFLYGLDPSVKPTYDNWLASVLEEDRERVDRHVHEAMAAQSDLDLQVRIQHPERGIRWLNALGRTAYDEKGHPVRLTGFTIDVTERQRADEALRAAHGELAERVHQLLEQQERLRALSVTNEELREHAARHIAHELHDEAGQILAAVRIALARIAVKAAPALDDDLGHVKALITQVEDQLRHLAHELRPTILDDLGLGPALEFLSHGVAQRWGLKIAVTGAIGIVLPPKIATILYRVAQEALTNVVRHAGAREVILRLERRPDAVRLLIRDDGKGFDVSGTAGQQRGLGLLGIEERVMAVDGTVEIQSQPGKGTDVVVTVPLKSEN